MLKIYDGPIQLSVNVCFPYCSSGDSLIKKNSSFTAFVNRYTIDCLPISLTILVIEQHRQHHSDRHRSPTVTRSNIMAAPLKARGRSRNILKMISSTLKDVKGRKRRASRQEKESNKSLRSLDDHISVVSESTMDDSATVGTFESSDSGDAAIQRVQEKAEELLAEIKDAFDTYTKKEQEVSKAKEYHMDRATGRFEGNNMAGAALSMRKVKQVQREYDNVSDAIQFFSFRKLELDRFLVQVKKAMESLDDDGVYASLEQQCLKLCMSLDDISSVLAPPDVEIGTSNEDLLKELETLVHSRRILKTVMASLKLVVDAKAKATKKENSPKGLKDALARSSHHQPKVYEPTTAQEAIQQIHEKSEELLYFIKGLVYKFEQQDEELSKALSFHFDRARGRFESRNSTGAALSMRKLKHVQAEYQHAKIAFEYFAERVLEMDQFLIATKKATITSLTDHANGELYSSLEQQSESIRSSLENVKEMVCVPPEETHEKDEALLQELSDIIASGGSIAFLGSDDYSSSDDEDFDLDSESWEEEDDDELLQELATMVA